MKKQLIGLAAILALSLTGCSAGVYAGSASLRSDPDSQTLCTHSYGAQVQVPDGTDSGLREHGRCVTMPSDDDSY